MDIVIAVAAVLAAGLVTAFLKSYWFQEKPTHEPEKTAEATLLSKEVRKGTHQSGRSKGGYSYVLIFSTKEGQTLELYAHEVEFGAQKEGASGLLTFRGPYFVSFE